jgi:ribose 5-phosphate isomerase
VLSSSDPKIADLLVTTSDHATIGLDYIVNLGDLNGDGTDEVYFVEDYGGCNSALREGIIATYKNKKWIVIQKIGDSLDYYPYLPDEVIKEALDLVKKSQETKQYEQELRAVEPLIIKKGKKNILQRV